MELVAAAKMRKSQEAALASRPYTNSLNEILAEVRSRAKEANHALFEEKLRLLNTNDAKTELIILITSDRGLVGGLNMNLFRLLNSQFSTFNSQLEFVVVGKKGLGFTVKSHSATIASFENESQSPIELARTLTKIAIDNYVSTRVDSVKLVYPHFQSTIKQNPSIVQLLPIELPKSDQLPETSLPDSSQGNQELLFEPSAEVILEDILPHYILTKIYHAILESKASEHSARMVAMKNATDAASDLVDDLTLTYNQARQETITTELLDIITAQKAFE